MREEGEELRVLFLQMNYGVLGESLCLQISFHGFRVTLDK